MRSVDLSCLRALQRGVVSCVALQFRFKFFVLAAAAAFTVKEDTNCKGDSA